MDKYQVWHQDTLALRTIRESWHRFAENWNSVENMAHIDWLVAMFRYKCHISIPQMSSKLKELR